VRILVDPFFDPSTLGISAYNRIPGYMALSVTGGFALGEKEHVSALQALSLAEGPNSTASLGSCSILRSVTGHADRTHIRLDLRRPINGKGPDVDLQAGDILVVPSSSAKKMAIKTAEAALQTASGLVIWRLP